jgi:hypothetical protein
VILPSSFPIAAAFPGTQSQRTQVGRRHFTMSGWLNKLTHYDDLSVALGATLAVVVLLAKWAYPVSLVHPLLLGRQAEVDRVRKPGESAVYRNYGTGFMGPVRKTVTATLPCLSSSTASSSPIQRSPVSQRPLESRLFEQTNALGERSSSNLHLYRRESDSPLHRSRTVNSKLVPLPWQPASSH